tara:strand:- start:54 stop:296 length:243 start_codon:yes stop_codon:yes gene_type:complete
MSVLVLRQNIHGFDQEAMVVSTKKQIRLNIREFVLANPILFKRAEEPLTLPESPVRWKVLKNHDEKGRGIATNWMDMTRS